MLARMVRLWVYDLLGASFVQIIDAAANCEASANSLVISKHMSGGSLKVLTIAFCLVVLLYRLARRVSCQSCRCMYSASLPLTSICVTVLFSICLQVLLPVRQHVLGHVPSAPIMATLPSTHANRKPTACALTQSAAKTTQFSFKGAQQQRRQRQLLVYIALRRGFMCSCHCTSAQCCRPFRRTFGRCAFTSLYASKKSPA